MLNKRCVNITVRNFTDTNPENMTLHLYDYEL